MDTFVIIGDRPLKGEVSAGGAKNAAFALMAASLLTDKECEISNLPLIEDIFRMLEILKSMGVKVDWKGERTVILNAKGADPSKIDEKKVSLFRGSVLLMGSLLARFGKVEIPKPGGCIIGARPIDTHLDAFRQMGAEVSEGKKITITSKKKAGDALVILNEFSVTATENVLLFSALRKGKTTIKTADIDYQVQELVNFLKKMGVRIDGAGSHTLIVHGSEKLKGASQKLIFDPIEAGTFILAAAATRSRISVKNAEISFLELPLKKLKDFGITFEISLEQKGRGTVTIFPWKSLKIDKVQSLPFPGIPSDLQSCFGVLATRSKGPTLIHDPLYESRLKYLEELTKMGAEIYFADPHRAIINGPTQLFGAEIKSLDLRGGASLILAGLMAKGKTTLGNVYQIDRGYEKIDEKLRNLGADIKRIKE